MRMVATLIIGGAVLGAIVYYMTTNCWNPEELQVSWDKDVVEEGNRVIEITVNDKDGKPIKNAIVTITGLETADSNKTGSNGRTQLNINPALSPYRNEGYLDIKVKASGCYKDFEQDDAIKVVVG
ncbi:MAG: hypothetical protein U9O96_02780 [Candidatus Thermoplasmatota archaeon]|nr:hypothetical protein [Candidatus Thermoplasmatota archaeon]